MVRSAGVWGSPPGRLIVRLAGRRPERISYPRGVAGTVVGAAILGATVLVVAEFLTLYTVRLPGHAVTVYSQGTGAHNSWAMIPLAVLALVLAISAVRGGGRYALTALAIVALVSLLIGLLVDLSDAQRTGLYCFHGTSVHCTHGRLVPNASSSPQAGMYSETFGSIVLIAAAGIGLLFAQPAGPRAAR